LDETRLGSNGLGRGIYGGGEKNTARKRKKTEGMEIADELKALPLK